MSEPSDYIPVEPHWGQLDCQSCGKMWPMAEVLNKKGNKFVPCKECKAKAQREQRYKRFFNITIEEYDRILAHQNGVCAICKQPSKNVRLAVDHDHKTGLIRGLLCSWCNRAISKFRDDVTKFENTVAYFKSHPATEVLGEPRYGLKGRVTNKAKTRDRLNRKPEDVPAPKKRKRK